MPIPQETDCDSQASALARYQVRWPSTRTRRYMVRRSISAAARNSRIPSVISGTMPGATAPDPSKARSTSATCSRYSWSTSGESAGPPNGRARTVYFQASVFTDSATARASYQTACGLLCRSRDQK